MSSLCLFLLSFFRTFDHKGLDWFEPNPCDSVAMFWTIKWIFENHWKCISCQCRIIPNLKKSASFLDTLINSLWLALLITVGNWKDGATWNMWFPRSGSSRWQEVVGGDVRYKLPKEQGELMSHWYSNRFNYFSPSDTFNQTRHQNADIASWREKMWYFFYSKKEHSADQYCILCHLATRYGDPPGNISFLHVEHLWTVDVALEKEYIIHILYYTCFLYMCFTGSVLLRLILNICIYQ